ncbi:MAG TPA: hypothetical protein VLE99_05540 [Candidatus Saccharimonadales bacterium]|nr:hypothetical protein [Candidatus Saccharimonadales bacterium]
MRRALVAVAIAAVLAGLLNLAACTTSRAPTLSPAASPTAAKGRTTVKLFELHNAALRFATKDTVEDCGDQAFFHVYGFRPGEHWTALVTTVDPQKVSGFNGVTSQGNADGQGQVVFTLKCNTYYVGTYAAQVYNNDGTLMVLIRFTSQ